MKLMLEGAVKAETLETNVFVCSPDMRHHVIYPDCDVRFTGHVTWVGNSSIEAKMHMSQVQAGALTRWGVETVGYDEPTVGERHRFRGNIKTRWRRSKAAGNNHRASCFSTVTALTLRSWMPRLSWWPEIQKTRGRNPNLEAFFQIRW